MNSPLIEPAELAELIDHDGLVVADVRYVLGGPSQQPAYEQSHVPGAQWIDLETELSSSPAASGSGGRHPLPAVPVFEAALRRIGVRADSLVVAYDADTSLSAARLWWLLTDAGIGCRVLNGGLVAWVGAGLPIETGPGRDVRPGDVVVTPGRRERVDADGILAGLAPGRVLVDVRTAERYAGDHEPIDPVAGHVPGAVSRPETDDHEPDGRFRPPAEIQARFADIDEPVFMCGSGITAAQSLLALESAGGTGAIYPGSWSDWISDPSRPTTTSGDRRT